MESEFAAQLEELKARVADLEQNAQENKLSMRNRLTSSARNSNAWM